MNPELLTLALLVGAANWIFRYGPMRLDLGARAGTGPLARFLAATGPAAIATLVVASVLPMARDSALVGPLIAGTAAVLAVWFWRRSVVLATLAGSLAYGVAFAALA